MGHGAEEFLGAKDFGGGKVGAARGVVRDEDAELTQAGLSDRDSVSVILLLYRVCERMKIRVHYLVLNL